MSIVKGDLQSIATDGWFVDYPAESSVRDGVTFAHDSRTGTYDVVVHDIRIADVNIQVRSR